MTMKQALTKGKKAINQVNNKIIATLSRTPKTSTMKTATQDDTEVNVESERVSSPSSSQTKSRRSRKKNPSRPAPRRATGSKVNNSVRFAGPNSNDGHVFNQSIPLATGTQDMDVTQVDRSPEAVEAKLLAILAKKGNHDQNEPVTVTTPGSAPVRVTVFTPGNATMRDQRHTSEPMTDSTRVTAPMTDASAETEPSSNMYMRSNEQPTGVTEERNTAVETVQSDDTASSLSTSANTKTFGRTNNSFSTGDTSGGIRFFPNGIGNWGELSDEHQQLNTESYSFDSAKTWIPDETTQSQIVTFIKFYNLKIPLSKEDHDKINGYTDSCGAPTPLDLKQFIERHLEHEDQATMLEETRRHDKKISAIESATMQNGTLVPMIFEILATCCLRTNNLIQMS